MCRVATASAKRAKVARMTVPIMRGRAIVIGEGARVVATLKMNYGDPPKTTVARTVDRALVTRKMPAISNQWTGHPFRQYAVLHCSPLFQLYNKISDLGKRTVLRSSPMFSLVGSQLLPVSSESARLIPVSMSMETVSI